MRLKSFLVQLVDDLLFAAMIYHCFIQEIRNLFAH